MLEPAAPEPERLSCNRAGLAMLITPASPTRASRRNSRRTVHVLAICALSLGLFALQASLLS